MIKVIKEMVVMKFMAEDGHAIASTSAGIRVPGKFVNMPAYLQPQGFLPGTMTETAFK